MTFDGLLLRRVQRHIEFRLPDASMRRELLAIHLPNPERVKANLRFASGFLHCVTILAEQSVGLSGGDTLNICPNAIHAGSRDSDPAKWLVTEGFGPKARRFLPNTALFALFRLSLTV